MANDGFIAKGWLLNSCEFGLPQWRKRYFILAFRKTMLARVGVTEAEVITLADDLLVTVAGHNHVTRLIRVTEATHEYLVDIGARVATLKSVLFSSLPLWKGAAPWRRTCGRTMIPRK